jgi:AcrR family transcriptional regulator
LKAVQNDPPREHSRAGKKDPGPGLRLRQKRARTERILAGAGNLFNTYGFDETTMAEIAASAEVSTPTVFNYFKTKDELLLALVLQVHHETRKRVKDFQPKALASPVDAICQFLALYTQESLESISRKTWRHVESTRIRMPGSDFVKHYDALSGEMLEDFDSFLIQMLEDTVTAEEQKSHVVAKIIFNHWGVLFMELIRDETMTIDAHVEQLREDLSVLIETIEFAD